MTVQQNLLQLNINTLVCKIESLNTQLPVLCDCIVHKYDICETSSSCIPMEMVLSFKYLGVIIHFDLKWLEQIQYMKNIMKR